VYSDASMIRLFGARESLASDLADLWLAAGSYRGGAEGVRAILDRQRLLETERVPCGCLLMTVHKSKGKEFDGVVLVENPTARPSSTRPGNSHREGKVVGCSGSVLPARDTSSRSCGRPTVFPLQAARRCETRSDLHVETQISTNAVEVC
jgi:hypothetical protein